MRRLALIIAFLPSLAHAEAKPVDPSVTELVKRVEDAWANGDAAGLGAQYTPDAQAIGVTGKLNSGANNIAAHYKKVFASTMKGARLAIKVERVRKIGGDAAIVDTTQQVFVADGSDRRVWGSWAVERDGGALKIAHVQNTTIAPAAAP